MHYLLNTLNSSLTQVTLLSVGKQIGAEFRGVKVWSLKLEILTESLLTIDISHPGLAWILIEKNHTYIRWEIKRCIVQRCQGVVVETFNIDRILARAISHTLVSRELSSGKDHILWM